MTDSHSNALAKAQDQAAATEPAIRVRFDIRSGGRVAFVTLDNARRLNVMNAALMDAFVDAMATLAQDEALRAVVLTGAGEKAFVAGADIAEMVELTPQHAVAFAQMGGALGNAIDRIWRGYVVDFISLHWHDVYTFPAFNLADSAITLGAICLLLDELRRVMASR